MWEVENSVIGKTLLVIGFYAISALFRPYNGNNTIRVTIIE